MAAPISTVDVTFLVEMIEHHGAAIQMATDYLRQPPTARLAVVSDLARNIITAQTTEVDQMTQWLTSHGITVPAPAADTSSSGGTM